METKVFEENTTIDGSPSASRWIRFGYIVDTINQMLIGFVTIYMSYVCLRIGLAGGAMHAWLCTIGYAFLMAEGVMTHYNGNTLLIASNRKTKTTVHWILLALGGSIGIAGGIVEMCRMDRHFYTLHGNLGFAAMILSAFSMFSGLSALFAVSIRRILAPLLNKTLHNFVGIATFVIAIVSQYYGYETPGFKPLIVADLLYMIEVMTLVSMVLCCIGPILSLWQKLVALLE